MPFESVPHLNPNPDPVLDQKSLTKLGAEPKKIVSGSTMQLQAVPFFLLCACLIDSELADCAR
jgi:hypothetical protein